VFPSWTLGERMSTRTSNARNFRTVFLWERGNIWK
jgi:hypothetical protein